MMRRLLRSFLAERGGATAVEYGVLAALVSVGLLTGLSNFSDSIQGLLEGLAEALPPPGETVAPE